MVTPDTPLRPPGPPHNPGLRDLVEGKQQWSAPLPPDTLQRGFRNWHERGYLPHRDAPGLTQFVTLRLADSLPVALRSEWEHLLHLDDPAQSHAELQAYLDQGRGACALCTPEIAGIVEAALLFFHAERYELRAWVVMPNHVHVLFRTGDTPLSEVIASWKKHTGAKANRRLGRRGTFWEADYWDTFMRDAAHELQTRRYIENNPATAGLVREPREWRWGSARLRDEFGELNL